MKKLKYYLPLFLFIAVAGCKKKPNNEIEPQTLGTVTINNKAYATVKLGNLIWTAENYNGPGGLAYNNTASKPEYGKYYTYAEVSAIALPQGWRIPTSGDFEALAVSQNVVLTNGTANNQDAIKSLTSKTNWLNVPGTNASGFNAYPAGYMFNDGSPIDGDISEFWTSDNKTLSIQENASKSLRLIFYYDSAQPAYRFNVRFVKNA